MPSPRQALTAFTEENSELARLESLLTRFNLFEAVGVVRHELRHSDFLAYLLDPSRNHGLGELFLREFLQTVQLTTEDDSPLLRLAIDTLDLSQAYVLREWHHVDILVIDSANQLAVIIENKIGTSEHSDQLNRYHADFARHYPGYTPIALYLTPDGDEPSSADYQAVSYALVCEVIERIAQNNLAAIDPEVVMVLKHYAQMLKRHILSDTEVAELCRAIYQNHRQALDLIFEHRPDHQAQINEFARSLIRQHPNLKYYNHGKTWINFNLSAWDASLIARGLSLYTTTTPFLSFSTNTDIVQVGIWVSPGEQSDRQKVLQVAQDNFLIGASKRLTGRDWSRVTSFKILNTNDFDKSQEEIEAIISERWAEFLQDELPRIVKAYSKAYSEEWLWPLA